MTISQYFIKFDANYVHDENQFSIPISTNTHIQSTRYFNMSQLRIAALLTLSISVIHTLADDQDDRMTTGQDKGVDQDEYNCSHGNLEYLCLNYEICSKFGLITESDRDSICKAHLDPIPGEGDEVEYGSSTKTPPATDSLTSERRLSITTSSGGDFTSTQLDDILPTSRADDDFSHTRDFDVTLDVTTDKGITTAYTTNRATSEYTGTPDSGVSTGTTKDLITLEFTGSTGAADRVTYSQRFTSANGIVTGRTTEYTGHTRDLETFTPGHSRDRISVTGTSERTAYTSEPDESTTIATEANDSDTTESDNSFTTGTKSDDSYTITTQPDDSYTTATSGADEFTTPTTPTTSAFSVGFSRECEKF